LGTVLFQRRGIERFFTIFSWNIMVMVSLWN
jgi:hypothetical protein